jgi:GT2 family glycosyltransferase
MGKQIPKIFILVLNWNGWHDTLDCLESLYRNDYPDYQVVLIDNNSQDDSIDRIREWADGIKSPSRDSGTIPFADSPLPYILYDKLEAERGGIAKNEESICGKLPASISYPLVVIQTGENLGFAGGNNVGLRYARQRGAEYVLLLNNDAMLRSQHVITTMIDFMETHPLAGACGGRLFYPDGSAQTSYGNFPSLPRTLAYLFPAYKLFPKVLFRTMKRSNVVPDNSIQGPLPVDYPSGACFLVRNKTINEVGLLDEQYFMYAEETDWCLRMMKLGWERYYLPQAEITHKYAGSFKNSAIKMDRYFLDSLFKYFRKNFSTWRLWILAAGYLVRSLYSTLHWTTATYLVGKPMRHSAQEQARHWRFTLMLAVKTIKDLLTGNISNNQEMNAAEVTR